MYALGIWERLTICTKECHNVTNMRIRYVTWCRIFNISSSFYIVPFPLIIVKVGIDLFH